MDEKKIIWTDDTTDKREFRGYAPLPKGMKDVRCPKCSSNNLSGVLISETADEADPNILCKNCGYWWN